MKTFILCNALIVTACLACNNEPTRSVHPEPSFSEGSFGYDLRFLQQHDSVLVLQHPGDSAKVIVSAKYQGKVFTSTADGQRGKSFGWINYKAFTAPVDSHMNAYGGENRLWLGPEGGRFSIFFPQGKAMTFANWKTPSPIDTEPWTVVRKEAQSVQLQKKMALTNYAGTPLALSVDRSISILNREALKSLVQLSFDTSLKAVGYRTVNTLTNTGQQAWTEQSGAPCLWILDMFNPSPQTTIVIPYEEGTGPVATTDYFGPINADRIKYANNVLFFKADGKSRGKLGLGPLRAKPVAGSYDAASQVLTITFFNVDKDGRYLNQEWNTTKPPYSGDAVNAYNDGPLEDGKQMGPFYEIESVSPAAFLQPGASLTHHHTVLHFTGNRSLMDKIAMQQLGVSLSQIEAAFR